jgi:hypothetical protein
LSNPSLLFSISFIKKNLREKKIMKKNSITKKITIVTVCTLTISSLSSLTVFTPSVSASEKDIVSEEVLSKEVLSDKFDLENEVEEMPSINDMTKEERVIFDQLVSEQAELYGGDQQELYKELLIDFFDQSSEYSEDIEHAQEMLYEAEVNSTNTIGIMRAASSKVKLGTKFVGSTINIAIGVAIGGGVGAIQAYIIKKGKKEAQKIFTKTVVSRLIAWGAPNLAKSAGVAVAYALEYSDVGYQIAKQLDKRDKYPNNGWIDIY